MCDPQNEIIVQQLKDQEPIFHRLSPGASLDDIDGLMDVGFFEVGASGRVYQREEILTTVFKR